MVDGEYNVKITKESSR